MNEENIASMMEIYAEARRLIDGMVGKGFLQQQIISRKGKLGKDFLSPGTYYNAFNFHRGSDAEKAAVGCSLLDGWSLKKVIYTLTPELLLDLADTEGTLDVPLELLYRLPQWTVYIPLGQVLGDGSYGCWVGMRRLAGEPHLCIGWDTEAKGRRQLGVQTIRCVLGERGMCHLLVNPTDTPIEVIGIANDIIGRLMNIYLYVCTQMPYTAGDCASTGKVIPRPRGKGWVCETASLPTVVPVWDIRDSVPMRTGGTNDGAGNAVTYRKAHVRRAHWHGYWTGPRDSEQTFILKWIPPTVVSASLPATTSEQV